MPRGAEKTRYVAGNFKSMFADKLRFKTITFHNFISFLFPTSHEKIMPLK